MSRAELLRFLATRILQIERPHPIRVAIDGIDAAGKTTLADELANELPQHPIIRASIDGFHQPRAIRYRRGSDSPIGYYYDSFDYDAFKAELLQPLGPGGSRRYRTMCYDYRHDHPLDSPRKLAPPNAMLLCDGVFLLRSEICELWDFSVFVQISFSTSLDRALVRDREQFGSSVRQRYEKRYIPGQRLYLQQAQPTQKACIVFDNNDPLNPFLI